MRAMQPHPWSIASSKDLIICGLMSRESWSAVLFKNMVEHPNFFRSEVGRLFKVFRELQTGRKRMDGSLSRFCDFDITTWVVAARLGVVEGSLSRRRDFNIRAWVVVA